MSEQKQAFLALTAPGVSSGRIMAVDWDSEWVTRTLYSQVVHIGAHGDPYKLHIVFMTPQEFRVLPRFRGFDESHYC